MQKIEVLLIGEQEKECAQLINDLAAAVMQHYKVSPVEIYCGTAPTKKGIGELMIPDFMKSGRKRAE